MGGMSTSSRIKRIVRQMDRSHDLRVLLAQLETAELQQA
jgi:hypothetical protein